MIYVFLKNERIFKRGKNGYGRENKEG